MSVPAARRSGGGTLLGTKYAVRAIIEGLRMARLTFRVSSALARRFNGDGGDL